MGYILMRLVTSGMKNLEKELVLNFQSQTKPKKISYKKNNIKAVFGENGAGKSSLIASVALYKNICLQKNYLLQNDNIENLLQSINKKSNEFKMKVIFAEYENDFSVTGIYSHEIIVKIVYGIPYIVYEKISKLTDATINGNYETLIEVENGEVKIHEVKSDLMNRFIQRTMNTLESSSLISLFLQFIAENYKEISKNINSLMGLPEILLTALSFCSNIYVYMEKNEYDRRNYINKMLEQLKLKEGNDFIREVNNLIITDQDEVIDIDKYDEYWNKIQKLTRFLQIFKRELKSIRIDKRVDRKSYICSKVLCYDGYEIISDRESTGIMKLMRLFDSLEAITKGGIVFIDELDANLHDVYLEKLLDYMANYANGQLCFTTHNISSMRYLKQYKNSIDFIGEDQKITSWIKNGNYNPENRYREGMISGSPFNIESFDFLSVFGNEDN